MSFVPTVLGDVPADRLGACYAHEHIIIIGPSFTTDATPDILLDDGERATVALRELHAASGRAMIDAMPGNCGRDVRKLVELVRRMPHRACQVAELQVRVCANGAVLETPARPAAWGAATGARTYPSQLHAAKHRQRSLAEVAARVPARIE